MLSAIGILIAFRRARLCEAAEWDNAAIVDTAPLCSCCNYPFAELDIIDHYGGWPEA